MTDRETLIYIAGLLKMGKVAYDNPLLKVLDEVVQKQISDVVAPKVVYRDPSTYVRDPNAPPVQVTLDDKVSRCCKEPSLLDGLDRPTGTCCGQTTGPFIKPANRWKIGKVAKW